MFPAFCFAKRTLERAGTLRKDALTVGMILSIIFIELSVSATSIHTRNSKIAFCLCSCRAIKFAKYSCSFTLAAMTLTFSWCFEVFSYISKSAKPLVTKSTVALFFPVVPLFQPRELSQPSYYKNFCSFSFFADISDYLPTTDCLTLWTKTNFLNLPYLAIFFFIIWSRQKKYRE